MDADSFTELALRVIAREGSDDDRRALEAEFAATPALRDEYEQLRMTHEILQATAPALEATHETAVELPAHRVGELRTAVRQHFGPAGARVKHDSSAFRFLLRSVVGGTGIAALRLAIIVASCANRTVEVGSYVVDDVRSGGAPVSSADLSSAELARFNTDAECIPRRLR